MSKIRERVENVLGVEIKNWNETFKQLDTQGKLTKRVTDDLIIVVLQYLEEKESSSEV